MGSEETHFFKVFFPPRRNSLGVTNGAELPIVSPPRAEDQFIRTLTPFFLFRGVVGAFASFCPLLLLSVFFFVRVFFLSQPISFPSFFLFPQ